MFINKTAYYKAGRLMKLRWKCRIKPWEEGKVFFLSSEFGCQSKRRMK